MGCYNAGCALATLIRGIYFVFLLLLVAQVMPTISLPLLDTTRGGEDIAVAAAAAAAAAAGVAGSPTDELPQADGASPDKRSVNTFPIGTSYYMSSKNHYELVIEDGKVQGMRPDKNLRGALVTVQTLPCQYNKTNLSQSLGGTGKVDGSCNAVTISSQMGKITRFICMSRKSGKVYAATKDKAQQTEECEFIEQPQGKYFQYYSHLHYKKTTDRRGKCRPNRGKRRKQKNRQNRKKNKEDPCKWYLEFDKQGRLRKGSRANGTKEGALFHKIDPNATYTVSPKQNMFENGVFENFHGGHSGTKKGDISTSRPRPPRPRKTDRAEKKDRDRKNRERRPRVRHQGGAPFDMGNAKRHHDGSRQRTSGSRTRTDHGGLFSRKSGNLKSQLSGMALTSVEWTPR